jgi:hypothetical protein
MVWGCRRAEAAFQKGNSRSQPRASLVHWTKKKQVENDEAGEERMANHKWLGVPCGSVWAFFFFF